MVFWMLWFTVIQHNSVKLWAIFGGKWKGRFRNDSTKIHNIGPPRKGFFKTSRPSKSLLRGGRPRDVLSHNTRVSRVRRVKATRVAASAKGLDPPCFPISDLSVCNAALDLRLWPVNVAGNAVFNRWRDVILLSIYVYDFCPERVRTNQFNFMVPSAFVKVLPFKKIAF